jgi:hypothetical protein
MGNPSAIAERDAELLLSNFLAFITKEHQNKMKTSRVPIILLQYYAFSEAQMNWIQNKFNEFSYSNVRWVSPAVSVLSYFQRSHGIVLDIGYKYASFSFVVKGKELRSSYCRMWQASGMMQDLESSRMLGGNKYRGDNTTKSIIKWNLTTGWLGLKKQNILYDELRKKVQGEYSRIVRDDWEDEYFVAFKKASEEIKKEVGDHVFQNILEKNVVLVGGGSINLATEWQQRFKEPFVPVNNEDRIFAAVKGARQFILDDEAITPICNPTRIDNIADEGLYKHTPQKKRY